MRRAPILASLPLLAALSCLLAPAGGAATLEERFDQTFPLPAGGRLQIANTNGTISIEAWDRDEARIEAGKEVKAATEELARSTMSQLRIVATPGPGGLRVETRFPSVECGFFDWLFHRPVQTRVNYRLHVPRRLELAARTANGGVSLTGARGKAVLETTNGTVAVAGFEGTLELETTNGNIEARHVAGAVRAETTNGGVDVELFRLDGDLSLASTNGGLTVRLPRDVRATVDAGTTNGTVRTDLPVTAETTGSRHLRGTLNGGGPRLRLSTTNGGIRILAF